MHKPFDTKANERRAPEKDEKVAMDQNSQAAGRLEANGLSLAELAEIELGTVSAMHALQRWAICCMRSAGLRNLTLVDVMVMQHVNHCTHNRRLADICFVLNIEDTHVVGYSLRKLIALGVIGADRHGKEITYSTTESGRKYLARYQEICEHHLGSILATLGVHQDLLEEATRFLRYMSGIYDRAARAASSR